MHRKTNQMQPKPTQNHPTTNHNRLVVGEFDLALHLDYFSLGCVAFGWAFGEFALAISDSDM